MRLTISQLAFVTVGVASLAMLVALSLPLWHDFRQGGSPSTAVVTRPRAVAAAAGAPAPTARAAARSVRETGSTGLTRNATLGLAAARGDSWIVVREGSSAGPVRYAGVLARGQTLRFTAQRLWVSLGAAGYLDATLNGKPLHSFPTGTIDIEVTANGIGPPDQGLAAVTPVAAPAATG